MPLSIYHVDFGRGPGSIWTLDKLYGEKNSQVDDERFYEYQCIGGAYGTFLCHNVMDSTYRGVMKIFIQVPYDGTQRAPAEHRKAQAQSIPVDDFDIDSQLNALSTLTTKHCKFSPIILDIKFGTQLAIDPVPGGYIYFVLTNYLPGIKLSKIIFWSLKASVHIANSYITSFRMSEPAAESDEWRDDEWIVWGMVKTQNNRIWFEDPNKHPDMSTWTL
ncbi:hypothetical protein BDV33DRAFT_190303 [Aspergillus novoparasiticus]|uniref:Uncharacterized protein n=1 Tax=Aspergillus novoparasiticus TaxID=986946 RepID=A0A5N6EXF0_9EURO|nr:hypothetical protein BDV33DRAFT_190303 [Aspergillus novoparasiticus]